MKIYYLPETVAGIIFDMDLTLYRNHDYYDSQIKNQVSLVAERFGLSVEAVEQRIGRFEQDYAAQNGGRKTSFGNTLLAVFSLPIAESVRLRQAAIRPEDYLSPDPQLQATLAALSQRFQLILVTNNPSDIARRTLAVLGCQDFFPQMVGLDDSGQSKPHPRSFELAKLKLGLPAQQVVSIGDRFNVDLEVPIAMGMGGILVEDMADVYRLPEILA